MKALKACLALLAALALCLSLGLCAFAETPEENAEATSSLAERLGLSYTGMSWDEIVQRVLEAHKIRANVSFG